MSHEDPEAGFADLHLHQFANLAFGGSVLWGAPSGALSESLGPCREIHGWHGLSDWVGNLGSTLFAGGSWRGLLGHSTAGSPTFRGWPRWDDFTHQSAHEDMLRRAVEGGLRLVVMLAVHNELLCRLSCHGDRSCDDMTSVDMQLQSAKQMQDHVDQACGGPARGWYRIVGSPVEAREVIASGRLAVILGVEVDNIFGSQLDAELTTRSVRAAVEKYYQAGVRHVVTTHFCDNQFGGAAFALPLHWSRGGGFPTRANPLATAPVYRMDTEPRPGSGYVYRGGHCNRRGLTPLGRDLIRDLMSRGMMIDVDHMSWRTRSDVLNEAQASHYPVVAGHTELLDVSRAAVRSERQLTQQEVRRIHDSGGGAAPLLRQSTVAGPRRTRGTADSFVAAYRYLLEISGGRSMGFGTDCNGFAGLPGPRAPRIVPANKAAHASVPDLVEYPFASPVGGGPLERSTLGERCFDVNRDGVAHVGMLPDFLALLRVAGLTDAEMAPLLRSAIEYVDVWERAVAAR